MSYNLIKLNFIIFFQKKKYMWKQLFEFITYAAR